MRTPNTEHANFLREERRAARNAAHLFTHACKANDPQALYDAVDHVNQAVFGWPVALRKMVREVPSVSPEIQSAFQQVWVESNNLPLKVGEHRAMRDAARVLLPAYSGPAVRLFRGTGADELRRRIYGFSWTADAKSGDRFALDKREMEGGSVLLETLAPPEAIISQVAYPRPFTHQEIEECKREHPTGRIVEYHDECEYVVDRRYLKAVLVVQRYAPCKRNQKVRESS